MPRHYSESFVFVLCSSPPEPMFSKSGRVSCPPKSCTQADHNLVRRIRTCVAPEAFANAHSPRRAEGAEWSSRTRAGDVAGTLNFPFVWFSDRPLGCVLRKMRAVRSLKAVLAPETSCDCSESSVLSKELDELAHASRRRREASPAASPSVPRGPSMPRPGARACPQITRPRKWGVGGTPPVVACLLRGSGSERQQRRSSWTARPWSCAR